MPGVKFTQRSIEATICPPGKKDALFFDTATRGFGLRVTSAGGKSFLAQYSTATGKRRVPLGAFGVLTVEEARQAARATLGEAAKGGDPVVEKRTCTALEVAAKADAALTFEKLVTSWVDAREVERRASYLREAKVAFSGTCRTGRLGRRAA